MANRIAPFRIAVPKIAKAPIAAAKRLAENHPPNSDEYLVAIAVLTLDYELDVLHADLTSGGNRVLREEEDG